MTKRPHLLNTVPRSQKPVYGRAWSAVQEQDAREDTLYLRDRFADLDQAAARFDARLQRYLAYCAAEVVKPDAPAVAAVKAAALALRQRQQAVADVALDASLPAAEYGRSFTRYYQSYRAILHMALPLALALDWRSPSYAQSMDPMFFRPETQGNLGVNYNRYESDDLRSLEARLEEVLGFDRGRVALRLTSSGMAAYNLIESFLLRHAFRPGDRVLIPHYVYFESHEQITSLPGIAVHTANTHRTDAILRLVAEVNPKVVFLDPIENTVDLRMTDIRAVLRGLASVDRDDDLFVVIDGTMLPGESAPFDQVPPGSKVTVLYYESCSKYLQLGLDMAMAGFVACPTSQAGVMDRLRRNTGAILYDPAVHVFPNYTRQTHLGRMRRMTRNALLVAGVVQADRKLRGRVNAVFPLLPDHPDVRLAEQFQYAGGVLTFRFQDPALNERAALKGFVELALATARQHQASLTNGVSFGFSLPRLSAAASMAGTTRPFLRLSVGDRSYGETMLLAEVLQEAFRRHLAAAGA